MIARIFDHFTGGEPEDRRFSKIAHAMRRSPFWTSVPEYEAPAEVSGEISPADPARFSDRPD
jgi:hypothetical protein